MQPVSPIDLVLTFLTPQEIYGFALPADYTDSQLERIPVDGVLRFCAQAIHSLALPGVSRSDIDRHFVGNWFHEPTRTRILNLLQEPNRGLVVPQALMLLARRALEICPDYVPDGIHGDVVGALLVLNQYMGSGLDDGPTVISDSPGPLGRELIANQHFNRTRAATHTLARYQRRWRQIHHDLRNQPGMTSLDDAYLECTGVTLDDLAAVGGYLWAAVATQGRFVVPRDELNALNIPEERVAGVLDLISADLPAMRAELLTGRPEHRTEWTFDPFERYPVIRLAGDLLLTLDARYLIDRIFGWLPILDIKFPPSARTKPSGHRKLATQAMQTLRHVSEVYTSEVLHAIAGDVSSNRRVYDDADLKKVFTAPGQRVADAAIDYPGSWIVIEVTTTQLRREAATAVPGESQTQDIDKLVDELDQIDSTIKALRVGESKLTGTPAPAHRRYLPLLVLPEGFPVNPITLTVIRERAAARGLLQKADVDPIEIVDIEELEMIEALQEDSGPSLLEILRSKQTSSLRNASMRDYIICGLNLHPGAPQRFWPLFLAALEPLRRALPGSSGDGIGDRP
ncbi:hypothetical protein [Actinacidiphila epipremni]|nr:hypothetical protein [Actinacidiphila epipremni]